jgi:rod shape determining protein RodA
MIKRFLLRFDWVLFLSMVALIGVGTVTIYSAGNARAATFFHDVWRSNLATAGFGLLLYFILATLDYRKYLDFFAVPAYAVSLVCLVAVLLVGSTVYGGRRWLWFFQPSEVSKLGVITMLAALLGGRWFPWLGGFRGFLLTGVMVGVPSLLILAEPDLGTTLTLAPAALAILFVAGVWRKGLLTLLAAGAVGGAAILGAVYEAEKPGVTPERRAKILKCVPLKPHQVKRVRVFLFPEEDLRGAGWNLRQAKLSIGSGGFSGKGIGKGELNHLKYLPPSISMNDFIFCVYAEETGFVGSVVLLVLFGALLVSGCRVAACASDERGRLVAVGFSTLIFAHVYVNVAMSIGLVPITGLPLPFISSGRTFLLTVMCGLGIIQSVSIHKGEIR